MHPATSGQRHVLRYGDLGESHVSIGASYPTTVGCCSIMHDSAMRQDEITLSMNPTACVRARSLCGPMADGDILHHDGDILRYRDHPQSGLIQRAGSLDDRAPLACAKNGE